jgi:hypothetical protein
MMRKCITTILLLGWMLSALPVAAATGTIDGTYRYAWSENLGWIDFGAAQGNVTVSDTELTGYAWGENVGWISLNCSNASSCGTVDHRVSNSGGTLSGYAWGENVGWIQFNPTGGGVSIDSSGAFSGYAWGENVGWIVFNCSTTASCGTVNYHVQTSWRPTSSSDSSSTPTSGVSGTVRVNPVLTIIRPDTRQIYLAGQTIEITWLASNAAYDSFRLEYSVNGGTTWSVLATSVSGTARSLSWTLPNVSSSGTYVRVQGFDATRTLIASDVTDESFRITGGALVPPVTLPSTDPAQSGVYDTLAARAATPDINTDKGLSSTPIQNPACVGGALIKGSRPAVYFCGNDGRRYVFPNEKTFFTWYPDFSSVIAIADEVLATIPIGGNTTVRPGMRLLKITTDPKVYAVARGGVLRWVPSERVARNLFGANWSHLIDDVSDAFFVNYRIGESIPE